MNRAVVFALAAATAFLLTSGPASALTGEAASDQFMAGYQGQVESFLAQHSGEPLLWENEDSSTYSDAAGNLRTVGIGAAAARTGTTVCRAPRAGGSAVCYYKPPGKKKWMKLGSGMTVGGKGGVYAGMMYPAMTAAFFKTSGQDVAFTDSVTDSGRTLVISGEIVSGSGETANLTMTASLTSGQLSLTGRLTAEGREPMDFNFATVKPVDPRPEVKFPSKRQIA